MAVHDRDRTTLEPVTEEMAARRAALSPMVLAKELPDGRGGVECS